MAPLGLSCRGSGEPPEDPLNEAQQPVSIRRRSPETILGYGTSCHVPEFDQILRESDQHISGRSQLSDGGTDHRIEGLATIREPEQDVGIGEVKHLWMVP